MSFALLGIVLDVAVLVCLGITIYYAARLSKSLGAFRANKKQMGEMIAELSKNIDQATAATINLRATGTKQADKLQKLVGESRALFSELQVMNEAGNSLAKRLESLSDKRTSSSPAPRDENKISEFSRPEPFLIHDRDFEEGASGAKGAEEWEDDEFPSDLQSKAEKELFKALRKGGKKPPASRSH